MTMQDEGVQYTELFKVIKEYSEQKKDVHRQHKALSLITDNFTPFNNLPTEGCIEIIESVLAQHEYLFWYGGRPSLAGIDAVITVAKWGVQIDWGLETLWKMIAALAGNERFKDADEVGSVLAGINALREFQESRV